MNKTEILTKTLRNGARCEISIVPDPVIPGDTFTTCWWLLIQIGNHSGRISARPHEMQPINGLTHALTLPASVAHATGAKVIGLTAAEAAQVNTGIAAWVQTQKTAAVAAREELAASMRAAAPGAPTWTISSGYGTPDVGGTVRLEDGSARDRAACVAA